MADDSDDKLTELDRLLNDPDVPMSASRVWELIEQLAPPAPAQGFAAAA